MIVTIDGPSGAGKSTIARRLADRLGFRFLDTGAMYRAVAWAALQADIQVEDQGQIAAIAESIKIDFRNQRVFVDGNDVSQAIRSTPVTDAVPHIAGNTRVRRILAQIQRSIGESGNIVTEGRDQGTAVFPDAQCKIYLTASPEVRARRRYLDLLAQGESVTYAEVLESQNSRDQRDQRRTESPLAKAEDAVEVITDDMDQNEVVVHLEWIVRSELQIPQ